MLDTETQEATVERHDAGLSHSHTSGPSSSIPIRALKMAPHGFELLLVAGVSYISWGIGVPLYSVLHHALFATGTIAAVHCVDAFRTIGERITQLGELEEAARKIGMKNAPEIYRQHLKRRKLERASYGVFTAFNCFFWVCGAFTYTMFIKMELAEAAKAASPFPHITLPVIHWLAACFALFSSALAAYKVYRICETPKDLEIATFADLVNDHLRRQSSQSVDEFSCVPSKPR